MKKINDKAVFSATLKGVTKAMTTVRADVQACFVFAFAQYEQHGNLTFLNRIRSAASTSKALPCKAVEEYACRYANVSYANKKFTSKNTKDRTVGKLDSKWFDSINVEESTKAPKQTDIIKMLKSLSKQIDKKAEANLLVNTESEVESAEAMITELVSRLKGMGFATSAK